MNWLIYLSGWAWGWGLLSKVVNGDNLGHQIYGMSVWTMTWIWICWKFIR